MLSPYFFPDHEQKKCKSHRSSFSGHTDQDLKPCNAHVKFDDQRTLNDPLFRFYFRRFLDLYQQLSLLKPALIQESVADNPWKLVVAVTLLNKTKGKAAIPIFWKLVERWPTPWAMSQANKDELRDEIRGLGTQNIRAQRLIEMSLVYNRDPPCQYDARLSRPKTRSKLTTGISSPYKQRYPSTPISHLPGTGPYALDSYRIFCTVHNDPFCEEWKVVLPTDKELVLYLRWKWAYVERKEWSPLTGRIMPVDISYLEAMVTELAEYYIHKKYGTQSS